MIIRIMVRGAEDRRKKGKKEKAEKVNRKEKEEVRPLEKVEEPAKKMGQSGKGHVAKVKKENAGKRTREIVEEVSTTPLREWWKWTDGHQ